MRRMGAFILLTVVATAAGAQTPGGKKRRPLPSEYGRVVIANHSEKAGLAPVVFDHWVHRSRFTCRLCHVDVGFAMKAGATDVRAADNASGVFCGACHNGNTAFESCPKSPAADRKAARCLRCHSAGRNVKPERDFATATANLPRGRFGNGIDWEKAEETGLIKLVDYLEGISTRRPPLAAQKDFALAPKIESMPEIIFSHKKHTAWSGCELCHPDIFRVKKGGTAYTMADIFDGKYCGVCHVSVAFPLMDCQRCHAKQVQ